VRGIGAVPSGSIVGSSDMPHETVLIIRPGALGDTILTLPLVDSIRAQNPDARITFLGNRSYKDLFPTSVDFQAFDDPAWLWLFNGETEPLPVTARPFDKAYAIVSRADDVVRNLERAGSLSILQCPSRPGPGRHVVEHLHHALGLPLPARYPVLTALAHTEKTDLIWLHPGSGGVSKCLPPEAMCRLARTLVEHTRWKLAVTAGEDDSFLEQAPSWKRLVQYEADVVMIRRPITELCTDLGSSKLFLGNDSGIAHLAAALGVPSAVFFVSSDPMNWAPWAPESQMRVIDLRGQDVRNSELDRVLPRINSLLR
jgi:heptosyltransferase III